MKHIKSYWWILGFAALFLYACDVINKDTQLIIPKTPNGTVVYTTPKNGVVMNLLTMNEYKNASSFRIASQPSNGKVSFVQAATLMYVPDTSNNISIDSFVLGVKDSTKNVETLDTIVIKFVPQDSIPCQSGVIADGYITQPNTLLTMNVLENDYFCQGTLDSTSLQIMSQTEHGTLQILNKRIIYTPNTNYEGYDFFVYRVCNNNGECGATIVKILVQTPGSGNCPGAQPDEYTFNQDSTADHILYVLDNDLFCDSVDRNSITVITQPQNGTVTVEMVNSSIRKRLHYQHSYGFSGTDYFRYRICTLSGTCTEAEVKINILLDTCTNVLKNDSLVYTTTSVTDSIYSKGTPLHVLENDILGCPVATVYDFAVSSQPQNGKATIRNGQLIYLANSGFKGKDTLEYGICVIGNPQSCTQRATVVIEVK